jgi:hypothetical protein
LLRGVALLIIFSDHVHGNPVRAFMPISLGFSDMAEWFVLLSGYVNGIRRPRVGITRSGQGVTEEILVIGKSRWLGTVTRCLKLYAAILLMHALTVGLLAVARSFGLSGVTLADVALPRSSISPGLWQILTLQFMLINSCVLALYLILIWLVEQVRARPLTMVVLSVIVYAAVQIRPDLVTLPSPWAESFYFNPFAWQLPFVLGIECGAAGVDGKGWIPKHPAALIFAAVVLELAFLIRVGWWVPPIEIAIDKATLAPLRLVHFYCVLLIGRSILPRDAGLLKSRIVWSLIICGLNPLVTYCATGFLATLGTILITTYGTSLGLTCSINVAGWILCILTAWVAAEVQKRGNTHRSSVPCGLYPERD